MPPRVKKKELAEKGNGRKDKKEERVQKLHKEPIEEPPIKFEPGPGDEIKPGSVDEMGNYYMDELDFLRLQAKKERIKACVAQADSLRQKVQVLQFKFQMETDRCVKSAEAFERASRAHEQSVNELLTELSKKYDINFKDSSVHIEEDFGKIIATDPTKGLPRLSGGPAD